MRTAILLAMFTAICPLADAGPVEDATALAEMTLPDEWIDSWAADIADHLIEVQRSAFAEFPGDEILSEDAWVVYRQLIERAARTEAAQLARDFDTKHMIATMTPEGLAASRAFFESQLGREYLQSALSYESAFASEWTSLEPQLQEDIMSGVARDVVSSGGVSVNEQEALAQIAKLLEPLIDDIGTEAAD